MRKDPHPRTIRTLLGQPQTGVLSRQLPRATGFVTCWQLNWLLKADPWTITATYALTCMQAESTPSHGSRRPLSAHCWRWSQLPRSDYQRLNTIAVVVCTP